MINYDYIYMYCLKSIEKSWNFKKLYKKIFFMSTNISFVAITIMPGKIFVMSYLFMHADNWLLKLPLYRIIAWKRKNWTYCQTWYLKWTIALDLIKSWTRGSADYRTSRCHCCCNVDDSSRTSRRRRGCQRCRSGWSPSRRYLCTDRDHRILSRCKAAGSLGRLIPQSFCKPQRDLTAKLNYFLTIFMTRIINMDIWYFPAVQKFFPSVNKIILQRDCKKGAINVIGVSICPK